MRHIDRAFTEAPSELSSSVEEAFKRGAEKVKQRQKIVTAVSVAAVLALICAAIALAAGRMVKPQADHVVAAPRGGGIGDLSRDGGDPTLEPADRRSKTSGDETGSVKASVASVDSEDLVYYANINGRYFHLDENCSGMMNALPCALNTVIVAGKEPCPSCVGAIATPWPYFATAEGRYYHLFEDCSGMVGAKGSSAADILASGKEPCPVCRPDAPGFCWATPEGTYYHVERACMGMLNARVYTEAYARYLGKTPCPVCMDGQATVASTMSMLETGNSPETGDEAATASAAMSKKSMTAEEVKSLVQSLDEKALNAKEFWIYPSSEANGAWVFYATGWDSKKMTFKGGAWYVDDDHYVCLGHSDNVLNCGFFTPGSTAEPDEPECEVWYRGGSHVPYGPELFASTIRTGEENVVHVWKLGEDGAPVELDTGKLYNLYCAYGVLCGETDAKITDCCFLREHDGQLVQVCGQPEETSAVEALPGCAALLDELRADYTVTGCLYRSMGSDTEAEVVTVNLLNPEGKPYHTYLFRERESDPFQTSVVWGDGVEVESGTGSIRIDAGLPSVTSGGIEVTYRMRGWKKS